MWILSSKVKKKDNYVHLNKNQGTAALHLPFHTTKRIRPPDGSMWEVEGTSGDS